MAKVPPWNGEWGAGNGTPETSGWGILICVDWSTSAWWVLMSWHPQTPETSGWGDPDMCGLTYINMMGADVLAPTDTWNIRLGDPDMCGLTYIMVAADVLAPTDTWNIRLRGSWYVWTDLDQHNGYWCPDTHRHLKHQVGGILICVDWPRSTWWVLMSWHPQTPETSWSS